MSDTGDKVLDHLPVFADVTTCQFDSSPSPDTLLLLPSGISVSGIESWVRKLAEPF